METATPARQKNNFLLGGRGWVLFLVFLVTLAALIIFSIRYYSLTHYTASPNSTLTVTGSPGQRIFITINAGNSVNGLWASPAGLTVTLSSPSGFSTQLVAPQEQSWSHSISSSNKRSDESISITGSFVIPMSIDANAQSVTGQIAGDIRYPSPGGFFFSNETESINIPVQILLLTPLASYTTEQLPLHLVAGIDIVLLLAIPAFFRRYDIRRKQTFVLP
jgi:hypothetical protein